MENLKGIKSNPIEELILEQRITNELLEKIYTNIRYLATKEMNIISTKPQVPAQRFETVNPELTESEQLDESAKIIRESKESI